MKKRYFGAGVGLLLAVAAEPAAAQTTHAVLDWSGVPEVQAELALANGDYLVLGLQGRRLFTSEANSRFLGADEARLTLGYEHFWNTHWSGGGTLRYVGQRGNTTVVPEVLLRHRSALGPLTFGQRLSAEYTPVLGLFGYPGTRLDKGQVWARLRVDLEKQFLLGAVTLRPRLSYEAATHLRLQRADGDARERTVQFTSLRGEMGVRVFNQLDVTPWVARQTEYLTTIVQTNAQGQATSGDKLNFIYPAVGLDVRFTFGPGRQLAQRQQLPTQH